MINYLINKANSFIFSTALPSINIMWSNFLIEEHFELLKEKAGKLKSLICKAHKILNDNGTTQIVPIIIGANDKAIKIAEQLQSKGFYILPVRPPTVPVNTSRLRLSLTADITIDEFKTVIDTVKEAI
jgi:8-amino-7-oxononanoate synthase